MAFDYGNKKENGQYENYPVKTEGEYVAPIRRTYVHRKCGVATTISQGIAETYAKNPRYYGSTFCIGCRDHFPINQFEWDDGVTLGEIGVAYPNPKLTMKTISEQEEIKMPEYTVREQFMDELYDDNKSYKLVVVAVQLPNGAIEVITNTQFVNEKIGYYVSAYDDDFQLRTNQNVKIVGYMLVAE